MRRNDLRQSSRGGDGNSQRRRSSGDEMRRRATSSSGEGTNQTRDAIRDGTGSSNPEASDPAVAHLENLKQQANQEIQLKVQEAALVFITNPDFHNLSSDQRTQAIEQALDRPSVWKVIDPLYNPKRLLDQMKSVHLLQQESGESSTLQRNILSLNMEKLARISSEENIYQTRKQHVELLKKKADGMINNPGQQQDTKQTLQHAKDLLSDMATHLQHNYRDDEGMYIYQRGHEIDAMLSQVERR